MSLFEFLSALIECPTITGYESMSQETVASLCTSYAAGFFEAPTLLPSGSLLWHRVCGKPQAKRLLIDAHMDTIGFAVSEHCANGFVKVTALGGIDPYILPSTPVYLYTKEQLYGVFTSVPPHLAAKDADEALKLSDLYVDTGLSDEQLSKTVPLGTPVGFAEPPVLLQNDRIAAHSLDDKACVATIFHACRMLAEAKKFPLETDVYVHLSVGEERSGQGARTLPYVDESGFDAALVMDVNFARRPGVKEYEALSLGAGPGTSYSATIQRDFTDFIAHLAQQNALPLQRVVEMCSTGTNAGMLYRMGIPCAVLSLPESNMHTYSECVSLTDMEQAAELVEKLILAFHTAPIGEVCFK